MKWTKAAILLRGIFQTVSFHFNTSNGKFIDGKVRSKKSFYTMLQENGTETNVTSKKSKILLNIANYSFFQIFSSYLDLLFYNLDALFCGGLHC